MPSDPSRSSGVKDSVSFYINGKAYTVNATDSEKLGPQDRLVDYIRDSAGLKGTKYSCREGGCGACVVSVRSANPSTGAVTTRSVNSCLTPVFSCDGWDITTVENLGNRKEGYHPIQKRLADFGGTQCGFCSSGMVMNMYSLMESKKSLRAREIESNFDGNICRCTGYRPILDAFKSMSVDCSDELKKQCADIEDMYCGSCPLKKEEDGCGAIKGCCSNSNVHLRLQSGEEWVKASTLEAAFVALQQFQQTGLKTRLVAGNTSTGIYKSDVEDIGAFIDISSIPELSSVAVGPGNLVLGSGVTLSQAIEAFGKASLIEGFEYASRLSKHIKRIANVPVRNIGTLAGNLMIKHAHREFPSDIFAIFETVGAQLSVASSPTTLDLYSLPEFLSLNMDARIVVSIHFKPYTIQHVLRTFKITRRYQNAHAYVNAGFLLNVDTENNYTVIDKPRIVFGGINNAFVIDLNQVHASNAEQLLIGKSLKDAQVLQDVANALSMEVEPDIRIEDGSVEYRKLLTQSLFYKVVLGIVGTLAKPELQSGGRNIKRGITSGTQTYDTDETTWPINKPVLKLESLPQVSGEAEYVNDINPKHGELFGAFVLSTVAKADIVAIDPAEAFKIPGVVRFIQASDIPGTNNYMVFFDTADEILAKDKVAYAGQPVGLIVAETKEIAFAAAKKVKVEYANVEKGVLSIRDAIGKAKADGTFDKLLLETVKSSDDASNVAPKQVITGEFEIGSQYHFQMETQIAICIPTEDGMDVYSATQWMDLIQAAIASTLNMPNNEINIQVRRLGGAYGSKISRCSHVATACALAAHITNKPVRVAMDLQTNMEAIGKRPPYLMKYEVSVDENGKIGSLKGQVFCATGISANEETAVEGIMFLQSMYNTLGWELTPANVLTNTAPNTWCRAPGSVPGISLIENIMEHIAFELKLDPVQVRLQNIISEGTKRFGDDEGRAFQGENLIPRMLEELNVSGEIEARKQFIKDFNQTNRWRKRGMATVPMRYPLDYFASWKYPVYVAIYKNDATVAVSHGGIECGQGINTKVAQVVAFEFEIPIEKIRVKPSNNLVSPNADTTGGSVTSEVCVYAAQMACRELKQRMAAVKEKHQPKSWEELVKLANQAHVRLNASYMPSPLDHLNNYNIWVVNNTEVEVDLLTGEYKIVRVDLIEDAGKSLNPAVDVGQVEGALVMGIGYWTTEKLIYDKDTGRLLTNGTWLYKPPLPRDIPEDMRITLLKDAPNPIGILRSKATGEPPQCSAVAVLFALKNAIYAARVDAGHNEWFELDGPVTPEDVLLKSLTTPSQFIL